MLSGSAAACWNGPSQSISPPHGLAEVLDGPIHAVELDPIRSGNASKPVTIRLADTDGTRNSAHLLLNKMYSWRGYGDQHVIPFTPKHTTFTASDGDQVVGTITLAVDSENGLAVDELFREEMEHFRSRPGAKVCELTKLAFDAAIPPKPLLAAMFHIVFIYGHRRYQCTDLFIEVNPRHCRFYEAMLGFERVGKLKTNQSVSAPSQLMRIDVSKIRERIDALAGSEKSSRSLYPYFFSPKEEDGIHRRLERSPTSLQPGHSW